MALIGDILMAVKAVTIHGLRVVVQAVRVAHFWIIKAPVNIVQQDVMLVQQAINATIVKVITLLLKATTLPSAFQLVPLATIFKLYIPMIQAIMAQEIAIRIRIRTIKLW